MCFSFILTLLRLSSHSTKCKMQTERRRSSVTLNPTGFLSIAMTALRLSVPEKKLTIPISGYVSLEEVSWHDNEKDCWVVIYDRVYDVTQFLKEHPGGMEVLLEYAGRDATIAFRGVGHSPTATGALQRFLIAELPPHERIYRSPNGIRLTGIPQ